MEKTEKEEFFGLDKAETLEQFESNLNDIIKGYSGREMAFIQAELYLNEYSSSFGTQYIKKHGIKSREELKLHTQKLQTKLRSGKGKERSSFLKSMKIKDTLKIVSEIELMAIEAENAIQLQIQQIGI